MVIDAGLCGRCVHARVVRGARSSFLLCAAAQHDPTLRRYPPLPVLRCHGFRQGDRDTAPRPSGDD